MALSFHNVPMYGHIDRTITEKREGFGWNNLGQRRPKFIALHRMVGTLWGTDAYFRDPSVSSLTDFGIGIASVDGDKNAGVILRWNDPKGYRAPWASGPVSAPYGDGRKVVDTYGINAVNRDGVSVETAGTDQPLDEFSWKELVHLCAWWIDDMEIPYTSLPLNPHTGINALIWHQEFTIGTGKTCPFPWLMANTNRLYTDIAAFLKPYQEGIMAGPETQQPEPEPAPEPTWSPPKPVTELALVDPNDKDAVDSLRIVNGVEFVFVNDRVRATRTTKRLQFAYDGAKVIGPDIKTGEEFDVMWLFKAGNGKYYYYTPWHSRVLVEDTERIAD